MPPRRPARRRQLGARHGSQGSLVEGRGKDPGLEPVKLGKPENLISQLQNPSALARGLWLQGGSVLRLRA